MELKSTAFEKLDLDLSKQYVQIVLGMDELYQSNSGDSSEKELDKEGLVPINLTNEIPNEYQNWEAVLYDLNTLKDQYLKIESEVRRNYMQQQIGSVIELAKWCKGEPSSFRERVRNLLYVNENPLVEAERISLHQKLDELLTKRGIQGSLKEKVQKWEKSRNVPYEQLESTLTELLAIAKEEVVQKMFPEMEDVKVKPVIVKGVPYSAYCDYVGAKMYINGDLFYTYEALKHLVTHEAFPGHTTHMKIRELGLQSGDTPLDAALVITNTASSSVFEGIGDNGIHFIDWVETLDDEIYLIYQQIRSIAGLNAAHMIHAEQKSDQEVRSFLENFSFGEENWINSRLRFFKHSLRAPFIYAYWRGNEAVNQAFQQVAPDRKQDFYNFLYRNMLSADTVKQYR
jgi:hypothetical protein